MNNICIYVGVNGCKMIVSKRKRRFRRNGLTYIEKERMFYNLLSRYLEEINAHGLVFNANPLRIQKSESG